MYELNSKVKVGDIVLINSKTIHSGVINTFTNGNFSHAALVISPTQLLEAIGGSGAQISSLLRYNGSLKLNQYHPFYYS